METEIHLFKRRTRSAGRVVYRWSYWFVDSNTNKRVMRICKGCKTRTEAEIFVEGLMRRRKSCTVADIGADMYLPNSGHLERRRQLGKTCKPETVGENRRFVCHVLAEFGRVDIHELKPCHIINYLVTVDRSASWKNQFIGAVREIYTEASLLGFDVKQPEVPRFHGKKRKSDAFSDGELRKLLQRNNFPSEESYLLFLLTAAAGLRISEARAFRACQFVGGSQMVVVDGFMNRDNTERNAYNKTGSDDNPRWRVAILQKFAVREIAEYVSAHGCGFSPAGGAAGADACLFKYNGRPFRIEFLRDIFARALRKAGIVAGGRKLTMHSLRYTYVTKMRTLLSGDVVQKMVGHSSLQMTDYYTRPDLDAAVESLQGFVNVVNSLEN